MATAAPLFPPNANPPEVEAALQAASPEAQLLEVFRLEGEGQRWLLVDTF